MKIRNLEIGNGKPCRVIAEIGTLHSDSYDSLLRATKRCIDAGADMVKTQLIVPSTSWWATKAQRARYATLWPEYELWANIREDDNIIRERNQIWAEFFHEANKMSEVPVFGSVFDESFLEPPLLDELPAIKLGHRARNMPALIERVVQSKKPFIISLKEEMPSYYFDRDMALVLYVIPTYPIKEHEIGLPCFGEYFDGASLHTKNLSYLSAAFMLGANVLEVHVKDDGASGSDTAFALSMEKLEKLIKIRDEIGKIKKEINND